MLVLFSAEDEFRPDGWPRSGRSPDWLKMKNAEAPAVKREEEEDWGK
jgi:hypothetical protein